MRKNIFKQFLIFFKLTESTAHSESDAERHSCTVAVQVWLDLAGSSRELVSFWGLETVRSLSREWVEIQGIAQGGVLTTELRRAKEPFRLNGNFFYWECIEIAAPWSYFCSFTTRRRCTYKTFMGVSRLTFLTVMEICLRHKDTSENNFNNKVRKRVMSKKKCTKSKNKDTCIWKGLHCKIEYYCLFK